MRFFASERFLSATAAVLTHGVVLFGANHLLVHRAEYGVAIGSGSVEVDLIAAPAAPRGTLAVVREAEGVETEAFEAKKISQPSPVIETLKVVAVAPAPVSKPSIASGDGSSPVPGLDPTTLRAGGGASSAAKPSYLKNPPPVYPEISRRSGEEGIVLVWAVVDVRGRAAEVGVKNSSGFPLLDQAAVSAVRRWRFQPARVGPVALESNVEVPIRFELGER